MSSSNRRAHGAVKVVGCFLILLAWARGDVSAALAAPEPDAASADVAARKYRDQGLAHFKKKEYLQAIEHLQKALALQESPGAMALMASAFEALSQYDEALRGYETVLEKIPAATTDQGLQTVRRQVEAQIAVLVAKVGAIEIVAEPIADARFFVDGQDQGPLRNGALVRVLPGVHQIRAEKSGFSPFTTSVEVSAGKRSQAKLIATKREGRLDIREKHNWRITVEIDGKDAGTTPFSTLLEAGAHRIRLHGFMNPDALLACSIPDNIATAGARVESAEQEVVVGLYETQTLELTAEEQDVSLRVESRPAAAILLIDGREVGKTLWEGRLPIGAHSIEVQAPGFVSNKQEVTLERHKQHALTVVLRGERDFASEEKAARRARVFMGVGFGLGAAGLLTYGITGPWALSKRNEIAGQCESNGRCLTTNAHADTQLRQDLALASNLGTAATVGLVAAGLGTSIALLVIPLTRSTPPVRIGFGVGHFALEGRF